jgi:hypothetical protein
MVAAILAVARALIAIARAISRTSGERMCCSEHTIVVEHRGRLWWRRHEWLADRWAPLGTPGAAASRRGSSTKTDRNKGRRASRPRAR